MSCRFKRILVVLAAMVALGGQLANGKSDVDSECLPKVSKKRLVYCESITVGNISLATQKSPSILGVTFKSKFFSGLQHVRTRDGWQFRKSGQSILKYPPEFSVILEPLVGAQGDQSPDPLMPQAAVRLPVEVRPRRVVVRSLDSSGRVVAEKSSELQEVVEPWTELRQPRIWYWTTITGVDEGLVSDLEVLVMGEGNALLGKIRGQLYD